MKFNTTKKTNRFLSRKDQFQLFMLVALLGIILIAMSKTADPKFWHWMFPPETSREEKSGPESSSPRQEIQTFKVSPEETTNGEIANPLPLDLSAIKDNSLGVRYDEAGIYYSLLRKISSLSKKKMQQETLKGISYSILNEHPDDYRGKLLEIRGNLRGLTLLPESGQPEAKNQEETRYYEGWIFTPSSGVKPYRVICKNVDQSLPLKQSYGEPVPVRVTGYFFKKQAYASQNGLNSAPLILAEIINKQVIRQPELQPISRIQMPIIWFVLIVAIALTLTLWNYKRSDSNSRLRMQRGKYLRQRLWVPEIEESDETKEEKDESE